MTMTHPLWLREQIADAVKALDLVRAEMPEPCAFVLGYLIGAAQLSGAERDAVNRSIYGIPSSANPLPKEQP